MLDSHITRFVPVAFSSFSLSLTVLLPSLFSFSHFSYESISHLQQPHMHHHQVCSFRVFNFGQVLDSQKHLIGLMQKKKKIILIGISSSSA